MPGGSASIATIALFDLRIQWPNLCASFVVESVQTNEGLGSTDITATTGWIWEMKTREQRRGGQMHTGYRMNHSHRVQTICSDPHMLDQGSQECIPMVQGSGGWSTKGSTLECIPQQRSEPWGRAGHGRQGCAMGGHYRDVAFV